MTTNSKNENDQENKNALNRIKKLKALRFRLIRHSDVSDSTGTESAYKRRGIELMHIPHSSAKVAKDFDDSI